MYTVSLPSWYPYSYRRTPSVPPPHLLSPSNNWPYFYTSPGLRWSTWPHWNNGLWILPTHSHVNQTLLWDTPLFHWKLYLKRPGWARLCTHRGGNQSLCPGWQRGRMWCHTKERARMVYSACTDLAAELIILLKEELFLNQIVWWRDRNYLSYSRILKFSYPCIIKLLIVLISIDNGG